MPSAKVRRYLSDHYAQIIDVGVAAINIALVFVICRYLFSTHAWLVFWGWDPASLLSFVGERHRFSDILVGLGSDPIMGLGNIAFPLNQHWFLSYVLSMDKSGAVDGPLAFAIGATQLFAATVLCGRLSGFAIATSIAGGWLIILTTYPLFGFPVLVTIWFFYPQNAEVLAILVIMVSATCHLGRGPIWRSVLLSGVIFLGLTHTLLALPTSLVLTLPLLGTVAGTKLIMAARRREFFTILLCWVGIGLTALSLGFMDYLRGLLSDTAMTEFPDLAKHPLTLYSGQVSLLLWTPITSLTASAIFSPERLIVGGGLIGCFVASWLGSPRQRELAFIIVVSEAILIAVGVSNYFLDYWPGPAIWYYESYLLPFFVLYFCFLVLTPVMIIWRIVCRALSVKREKALLILTNVTTGVALPLAIGLYARAISPAIGATGRESPLFALASPLPQPESAITRILKSEIRLIPGEAFRGRVAVMTGRIFPEKHEWQHYSLVHYFAQLATGNLHDGPGLWQDDLPTVMEYNTLITPANFAFLRAFLTEPDDSQSHAIIGMRHIDLRILRSIGARFVITDLPVAGGTLRTQIAIPVSSNARQMLGFSYRDLDSFNLYLYELDGVNLGQFSPTEAKITADANQAIKYLSDITLDPAHTVVVSEPLPDGLTPAKLGRFTVGRDQYRLRASSTGWSVLLLPIEFSRCLNLADAAGGSPRLFRADLMLTGVLFDRVVDAQITFRTSPFHNSRCRLADLQEINKMDIRNAFKDRPAFAHLRPH